MQILLNGLCNGALIALLAMAFSVVYMPTRVFYIALAGIYALSAYVALQGLAWGWHWSLAMLIAVLVGIIISVLNDLLNHRSLDIREASSSAHMISPLGVYVVLVQLVVLVWGNNPQTLRRETAQVFRLEGGISIAQSQLTVLVGAAIVFILLGLWLQKSRLGLEFRGLANNPTQMALLGYNTDSLRLLAFGIAGALSAIAGLMSAYDLGFNPYVGMHAMLLAIVATIIGGKNTFIGPIVGGLLLGVVRALAIWYVSASWQDAITFLILAVFLFLRPQGIIGKKERLEVTA